MPRIPSPDAQLEYILNRPGLTPKQIKQAEAWAEAEKKRREQFGQDWVKDTRARSQARSKEIDGHLHELTQASNDLYDRVRRHEFDDVKDGFREANILRKRLVLLERAIEALESTEETMTLVSGDPVAYFESFYDRFPALAEQVPTIADAFK